MSERSQVEARERGVLYLDDYELLMSYMMAHGDEAGRAKYRDFKSPQRRTERPLRGICCGS